MNGDYNRQGNNNGSFGGYDGQGNNNGGFGGYSGQGMNNDSFGGYNGQDNNGGFGVNNPQQYDPNEPMYKPENSYDMNAPLYTPSSAPSTVTINRPKQNSTPMVIVAIILAVAVGIGVYFYITRFSNQSVKQFLESAEGKTLISDLLAEEGSNSQYDLSVYADGDDKLVCEYKLKSYTTISQSQKDMMKSYIDAARSTLAGEIEDMMKSYDIREFSFVYKYVNANGDVFGEYEISLADKK